MDCGCFGRGGIRPDLEAALEHSCNWRDIGTYNNFMDRAGPIVCDVFPHTDAYISYQRTVLINYLLDLLSSHSIFSCVKLLIRFSHSLDSGQLRVRSKEAPSTRSIRQVCETVG